MMIQGGIDPLQIMYHSGQVDQLIDPQDGSNFFEIQKKIYSYRDIGGNYIHSLVDLGVPTCSPLLPGLLTQRVKRHQPEL